MARHEYISYKLINPIITSWNHNKLDYAQGNTPNDFSMKIQCEAVTYGSGAVSSGEVEGFGVEHYDTVPSPLIGQKNETSYSPSFISSKNITNNISSTLDTVFQQINTYQNTQQLNNIGTTGIINNLAETSSPTVNGLQGISFPLPSTTNAPIVATPINLGI